VSGQTGVVSAIGIKLEGLTHTFPSDLKILLVAPSGQVAAIMISAGGADDIVNADLVFNDAAATAVPNSTAIIPGTYRPANYGVNVPLPPGGSGLIGTNLMALASGGVNGEWKLFVTDEEDEDLGSILGWSLLIYFANEPRHVSGVLGSDTAFNVVTGGAGPFRYQWFFNGQMISGATNSALLLTNLQFAQTGDYWVQISNASGHVTNAVAHLTVSAPGPLDYWSGRQSGISLDLFGLVYGHGIFVAVGDLGAILISSDGITWTNQSVASANVIHGVTYGNGTFVAVGKLGLILTSPDGVAWTQRVSGTDHFLEEVTYGNGLFVAVGAVMARY
jgi:subtilisin-like proprotein convertase family protein